MIEKIILCRIIMNLMMISFIKKFKNNTIRIKHSNKKYCEKMEGNNDSLNDNISKKN